ncbi:hypothetical protein GCM10009416_26480 [Craurococcus roseus]|uniref:histidine kinase n=1 Tax=Craurococcus roseus TaxID=77585 RepID=A0ABN1FAR4_9PROT
MGDLFTNRAHGRRAPATATGLGRDTLLRLFEAAPNPYLVLRPDAPLFTIVAASDAYLAATGTTRAQVLGLSLFTAFPANPDDPADDGARALAASLSRVLATREPDAMGVQRYDIPGRGDGGKGFQLRYWGPRNLPVLAPDGTVELILHQVEDVTDLVLARERADLAEAETMRRAAEVARSNLDLRAANAALRETEDHLRHVVELNPQIPWTADPHGGITDFNERWLAVTGLSRQEALGEGWVRVPHPEDLPGMSAAWQRAVATGEPYDAEVRLRMAQGGYRWWRVRAFPRRGADGRILRWYGTTEDVHDRRTAEEALRAERERLSALVAQAAVGIAETNAEGRFILTNGALCAILGRAEAEMLGRRPEELAPDGDAGEEAARSLRALVSRALEAGEPAVLERRLHRPDGTTVWAAVHAGPVRDASGSVRGGVGVVVDTTERREAERRQTLLVAELNHRAKNMLATVQAVAAQTLRGTADEPERFARHFSARLQALARAHDLLTRMAWTEAALGDIVRAALVPWLGGTEERIEIAASACAGVRAGPYQVQALVLALHELATNAAKHGALSRPGGRVKLSCRTEPDGAAGLSWVERGGPPVSGPPARPGFGTRLLERGLARDLGPEAAVSLFFEPAGLRAEIGFLPKAARSAFPPMPPDLARI